MFGSRVTMMRLVAVSALLLAGCETSRIVPVSGVLKYKGKPVTNAFVDFIPEQGRPSWGQTDQEGRFTLNYDNEHDGAMIGKHKVAVRFRPTTPAENEAMMRTNKPPLSKDMVEFFEKYGPGTSKQEVVIEKATKDLALNWD